MLGRRRVLIRVVLPDFFIGDLPPLQIRPDGIKAEVVMGKLKFQVEFLLELLHSFCCVPVFLVIVERPGLMHLGQFR